MDTVSKKAKQSDDNVANTVSTERISESSSNETNSKKMEVSEYVLVTDSSGEILEIPTNSDNSVFMATLQATVAGATGLKYRNPKTGASRAVVVDPTGTKLLAPTDGWDDKTFMAIVANAPSRGPDVSVKRRKMGGSDGEDELEEDGRLGRKRLLESSPLAATPGRKTAVPEHRKPVDLIVLGVSYKTTEQHFRQYFEQQGSVTFAEIKKNADGQSKGFGFVQMSNIEDQDKVLAMGQHTIDGRRCDIKIPEQRQDSPGERSDYFSSRQVRANKIFVGRMTDKIDEKSLREYFTKKATSISPSCTVSDVFIPSPFRGFAFVTLSNADVASKICSHKSYVINDVSVAVSLAVPRDEMAKDAPQQGQSPGYYNDFNYAYGYNRGSAIPAPNYAPPSYVREQYAFGSPAPAAPYPGGSWQNTPTRPPPNSWVPSSRTSMSPLPPAIHYRGQPGPSIGPPMPPNMPPHMPPALPMRGDGVSHSVGNQIASGLDALNLNQRNPEVVSAAWNSFLTTLNNQQQNHNGGGGWNG